MAAEPSESTRREYAAGMNRVVDYIEEHLTDTLDLERLAAVACFSPFHFHRLFRAWIGGDAAGVCSPAASGARGSVIRLPSLQEHFRYRTGLRILQFRRIRARLQRGIRRFRERVEKAQDLSIESQAVGSGRRGFFGILKTAGSHAPQQGDEMNGLVSR